MTRARALRASNSIEGINVTDEDAIAAVDGEDPTDADRKTWQEIVGYQSAMDYILQRCRDKSFSFTTDVILAVHFMICRYDLKANPGNYRPGWVGVRNTGTGVVVHEGVDRDELGPLVEELVDYMNSKDVESPTIKAAMTHLNLAMLHPFSDGNGRTARCLQTAVLTHEGIIAPTFSSIEEYLGFHQQEYYDVLARVGGGRWSPQNDSKPWIRFCITAHYRQAQILLRRSREFERVYGELEELIKKYSMPERMALALTQAAFGRRVRNSSYRVSAEISKNLASRDLKELVDAGLLIAEGERRGRQYGPAKIISDIRQRNRLVKSDDDPFAGSIDENQPTLDLQLTH
jgi:Fic family protein